MSFIRLIYLLMIPRSQEVLLPISDENTNSIFESSSIKQNLAHKNIVIYGSNTTQDEVAVFFKTVKSIGTKMILNTDIYIPFSLHSMLADNILFLVLLKKGNKEIKFDMNFAYNDVFLLIEYDRYDPEEQANICKSILFIPKLVGIFNMAKEKLYVCRYYYNGYKVIATSIEPAQHESNWKTLNSYDNFKGYEFNVGYENAPPKIYK